MHRSPTSHRYIRPKFLNVIISLSQTGQIQNQDCRVAQIRGNEYRPPILPKQKCRENVISRHTSDQGEKR